MTNLLWELVDFLTPVVAVVALLLVCFVIVVFGVVILEAIYNAHSRIKSGVPKKTALKLLIMDLLEIFNPLVKFYLRRRALIFWWWQRLWIRKDEFHSSLNTNYNIVAHLTPDERSLYYLDLAQRRQIAHQRDLD